MPRTLDEYVAEDTARRIEETLGHARTVPRDLTEYDRLPLTSGPRWHPEETTAWPSETAPPASSPRAVAPATKPVLARLRRHLEFLGLTQTLAGSMRSSPGRPASGPVRPRSSKHILGAEAAHKLEQRITRRIDTSRLAERKTLEAFDWAFQPGLDKAPRARARQARLRPPPRGPRDHRRQRHGQEPPAQGLRLASLRAGHPHALRSLCRPARRPPRRPRRWHLRAPAQGWARPELLIIDDVGLGQVKKRADRPTAAHTLYNLIDRRHDQVSTAVTSNIALSDWGRYLGDATLTAAILDRLAMHAIRIDIDGPSWRQHVAKTRAIDRGPAA
ncbi:MAG: ATP-binding protein [Myxococcales bacterium]|nr:ATP-binding protein [Myxococcales bacterium]